jgi:hypothetical protein
MTRRLKPLHAILALACGAMGVLTAVVEVTTLPVFDPGQDFPFRRAIALELVRDEHSWCVRQAFEELTEECFGRVLVPPRLH